MSSPRAALSCFFAIFLGWFGQLEAQTPIFSDDFETGALFNWTDWTAGPAQAFRFADLDLRDPHLFLNLSPFGCIDFTDTELPFGLGPSFNEALEDSITLDGDTNGFLDLSLLLLFRPLDSMATTERVDSVSGRCTAPLAGTSCNREPGSMADLIPYDGFPAGNCLEPSPGTTSGYSPAVTEPAGPCFVTQPRESILDFNGLEVPLIAGQTAATLMGDPVDALTTGLFLGFLRESDADALLLPADLPIVGGQPLSTLLPGGTNGCASGDDRDMFMGEMGWWFYLNFEAQEVLYTGP